MMQSDCISRQQRDKEDAGEKIQGVIDKRNNMIEDTEQMKNDVRRTYMYGRQ